MAYFKVKAIAKAISDATANPIDEEQIEKIIREHVGDSCLAKSSDDEPIFVLRAQDALAPYAIKLWAERARWNGLSKEKYDEALAIAHRMTEWPSRKHPD